MGKVGSTSVVRSLRAAGWPGRIHQFHGVNPKNQAREEQLYRRAFHKDPLRPRHLWTSQYFARRLAQPGRRARTYKLVTLVRDPVARNLSSFFQILELELDWAAQRGFPLGSEPTAAELSQLFLDHIDWHDDPLEWFDVEFKPAFGIDVYAQAFPKERGYTVYAGEGVEALVLKLERLQACAGEAFQRFLGLPNFNLASANVTRAKATGARYQEFLASIVLPDHYLDRMYRSQYVQHFYTEAQIAAFRARWQRSAAPLAVRAEAR